MNAFDLTDIIYLSLIFFIVGALAMYGFLEWVAAKKVNSETEEKVGEAVPSLVKCKVVNGPSSVDFRTTIQTEAGERVICGSLGIPLHLGNPGDEFAMDSRVLEGWRRTNIEGAR
jgi:hypothetical protein